MNVRFVKKCVQVYHKKLKPFNLLWNHIERKIRKQQSKFIKQKMHEKLISSGSGIIKDLAYVIGSFCCAFGSLSQLKNDDRVSVSRGLLFSIRHTCIHF